mmetsp:Transcript_35842/g.52368  ORF Transcript_35842/g.52368 Transcript_35842/m.52368 type:complete len:119 (+) Transcript_35842:173-529(+)
MRKVTKERKINSYHTNPSSLPSSLKTKNLLSLSYRDIGTPQQVGSRFLHFLLKNDKTFHALSYLVVASSSLVESANLKEKEEAEKKNDTGDANNSLSYKAKIATTRSMQKQEKSRHHH